MPSPLSQKTQFDLHHDQTIYYDTKGSVEVNITPYLVHRRVDAETARAKEVISNLEDGNISAAVRILCSDDTPADFLMRSSESCRTNAF